MTIKEIEAALTAAEMDFQNTRTLPDGKYNADAAGKYWDSLPRITYDELPDSLKKKVRDRFTADTIRQFLIECYPEHDTPQADGTIATGYVTLTADIPKKDMKKLFIRTRNTAVYTIEAQERDDRGRFILEPSLYGNNACDAFEQSIDEYHSKQPIVRKGKKKSTIARAKEAGQIVSVGYYQRHISDKNYMHALTAQKNKTAYIAIIKSGALDKLHIDQNGIVTFDEQFAGVLKQSGKGKYTDIAEIDFPLLIQCYTAAFEAAQKFNSHTVTVYLPEFLRRMNIKTGNGNTRNPLEDIKKFDDLWGIMENEGTAAKVFSVIEINQSNQTLTFAVPYIMRLLEQLELTNKVEKTTKKGEVISYNKPFDNQLIHSAIVSERNKTAVEIVTVLIARMFQRGFVPDVKTYNKKNIQNVPNDEISYHDKFRAILNDCPLLRARVNSYKTDSDKNKALRRAFDKAYKLIHTRTDAEKYFCNLEYSTMIPTMTTLDRDWTFTHTGRNGKYKPQDI